LITRLSKAASSADFILTVSHHSANAVDDVYEFVDTSVQSHQSIDI
jgi:hypothetical protein